MADEFEWDVFIAYSKADVAVARDLAKRLRDEGLRVWPGSRRERARQYQIGGIEGVLDRSRVLLLCMSAAAFGDDWAQLEAQTLSFRDPLNTDRCFIPVRLDSALISDTLAQFASLDWQAVSRRNDGRWNQLLEFCRAPAPLTKATDDQAAGQTPVLHAIKLQHGATTVTASAFSPHGQRALSGSSDATVRLWDLEDGRCLRVLEGHNGPINDLAWSPDGRHALSGSDDTTVRLWDLEGGRCLRVLEGHTNQVLSVARSPDGHRALSGSSDRTARLWDLETGQCLRVLKDLDGLVTSVTWSSDGCRALSGSHNTTVWLWDLETGRCLRVLEGHAGMVWSVAWSPDGRRALSSAEDTTVRLWDLETGRCLRVLAGHTGMVTSVAWSPDGRRALSSAEDTTVRLWDLETGQCLRVLEGHAGMVWSVAWSPDGRQAYSGDNEGVVRIWDLVGAISEEQPSPRPGAAVSAAPVQVQYTNAKVLLVGDSGAGKTGLSKVLAGETWEPSDSTVGAWATQWKLPVEDDNNGSTDVEREIWLWDFGGQADQRLIHQLYMDETALAVLVFDGQKEDVFETLGQWDRDLTRASQQPFKKLLAAGRVDTGGLRVSRSRLEAFAKERMFSGRLFETSAKVGTDCEELKAAICAAIDWDTVPWRTSPLVFKRLKEEIVRLKDEGRVLLPFNELRATLRLRLAGESEPFTDAELKAVIGLLAGPGAVWELKFGDFVLLQPEIVNAYAQAVIQTMREDQHERGCILEERVLKGELTYHSSMTRLEGDEERFILLAMHQILLERGLCLREHTELGPLLIFPSYYRRERPELVEYPAVHVSYQFNGFLDDVYATLVVRLHHTSSFEQDELWRYAADFKTLTGKKLGVRMTRRAEGAGELDVYFDPTIPMGEKIIFSRYVHEHLAQKARDVVRLRLYACQSCSTPVGNREVAMRRLDAWLDRQPFRQGTHAGVPSPGSQDAPSIICVECEQRVPLWDEMEQHFASDETRRKVRELQEQAAIVLDTGDKERTLVGEVIATVSQAGQIARELTVADHGIDMEIEFKLDPESACGGGEATGRKLYLQLKSGDSYLERRRDGREVFKFDKPRHVKYWMNQSFPVMLAIRASDGTIRWMEVREHLKRVTENGKKQVRQIDFAGEAFNVESVRRWRDWALRQASQ